MSEEMPEVRYVGIPDGPRRFVPEFGLEVDTFTIDPGGNRPALSWHVPLNLRGPFRPDQLANFDSDKAYKIDKFGYVLCTGKKLDETECSRKAVNRYPRCTMHGGRLHPLDKLIEETGEAETEETLSRYQLFLAKQITVEDLDDEELLACGFRKADGKLFKPKNIPRAFMEQFTRAIFDRSLDKLKNASLEAANTLASLMVDPTVDASVRRQCAESILDRTIGKAPLQVSLTASAPWESVFAAISTIPLEGNVTDVEEVPLNKPALPPDLELPE